jgi:lipoate synthase
LLGNICARRSGFCAVPKGRPLPIDYDEPRRVAEAVAQPGLRYAVITSVDRDVGNVDAAHIFCNTIRDERLLPARFTPERRTKRGHAAMPASRIIAGNVAESNNDG